MVPALPGRVFTRLERFANLPPDLQEDTLQFQTHAELKTQLFQMHHYKLVKHVYSVKGKELVDFIIQWLHEREMASHAANSAMHHASAAVAEAVDEVAAAVKHAVITNDTIQTTSSDPTTITATTTTTVTPISADRMTDTSSLVPADVTPQLRERARQIAEALVLSGFLTPHKDDKKHLNATSPINHVRENDLLIPVAKSVTELKTTSVWSVADGAVYASFLKRKGGLIAQIKHGKDVYVVFNEKTNKAYVFESDLARESIAEFAGENFIAQFDNEDFEFGVRVEMRLGDEKDKPEVFNALTKEQQEGFLNAWLNIGAHYREVYNAHVESARSIYELVDRDIFGNEVPFTKYRGRVLLIVNVSSKCGLTPTNYPELVVLDERYHDQGLEILAFPCNQFSNEEPGTNEEIVEFVRQYNCQFTFFEKGDVNGSTARPVFTYLKAKLPGTFGSFVKWNFTKFLVDRNGQPYKRYAPKDLPLTFEDDIIKLLDERSTEPLESELLADADTAVGNMQGDSKVKRTHHSTPFGQKMGAPPIGSSAAPAAT